MAITRQGVICLSNYNDLFFYLPAQIHDLSCGSNLTDSLGQTKPTYSKGKQERELVTRTIGYASWNYGSFVHQRHEASYFLQFVHFLLARYNKKLNDWLNGKQRVCFTLTLDNVPVEVTVRILGKQNVPRETLRVQRKTKLAVSLKASH